MVFIGLVAGHYLLPLVFALYFFSTNFCNISATACDTLRCPASTANDCSLPATSSVTRADTTTLGLGRLRPAGLDLVTLTDLDLGWLTVADIVVGVTIECIHRIVYECNRKVYDEARYG